MLKTLVAGLVAAGVAPSGPIVALQMDALMGLLVAKGVMTLDEWDGALTERIENALSRMPEPTKIVTPA